jgi:lactate dehydrogenase-like 2-hydroxyacid dehydrogenase
MHVFVGTRSGRPEGLSDSLARCRFGTVDEVVKGADFISVHTPAYTPVLSRDLLKRAKREVIVIATTLGLPFYMTDIAEFLDEEKTRKVICDLCAAGDVPPGELPERFTVAQVFSARTLESVQRAERELIQNLRRYAGAISNA